MQLINTVLALGVWSTHVHVVLGANEELIEKAAGYYKNGTRKALHDQGMKGKVWTKGYDMIRGSVMTRGRWSRRLRMYKDMVIDSRWRPSFGG